MIGRRAASQPRCASWAMSRDAKISAYPVVAAGVEHAPHVRAQGREILLDHRPDGVQAHAEIGVNETIARTGDQTPRDRRLTR
ncbi:MAG: hypothetical protein ABIO45_08345, partial [Burkholderiaceae bacterium]